MTLVPIPQERQRAADPAAPPSDLGPMPGMAMGDGGTMSNDGALEGVTPLTIPRARQQLVGIETVPVARQRVGGSLRVPGVAEAPETALAEVHVRVPGFLERLAVRETGIRVTRGEILAWFYSPQIYQAEQELLTTHRWGAHRPAPVDGPSTDLETAARTHLELLGMAPVDVDEILRTSTVLRAVPIRSPASGYVTGLAAVLGLYAQPETVLYAIADLSRVWVVASLYARDVSRVRRDTPARFVAADAPNAPFTARVERIEPEVSTATHTARVRLTVENPGLRLRPGQYGDIVFELPTTDALVVPRDAVIDTGTQQYVYVNTGDGRFEPRRVQTGGLFGDVIEVNVGLHAGEQVVARGTFMLDSESRLEASFAEVPAAPGGGAGGGVPSAETGPDCERDFDRQRYPDRYRQCRACERMHRGMGSMEADCKSAIARPWR